MWVVGMYEGGTLVGIQIQMDLFSVISVISFCE